MMDRDPGFFSIRHFIAMTLLTNGSSLLDIFLVPDNPTAPPGVVDRFYLWMAEIASIRNEAVANSLPALSNSTTPVGS